MLSTNKAKEIRDYYYALEELILVYAKYQAAFAHGEVIQQKNTIRDLTIAIQESTAESARLRIALEANTNQLEDTKEELTDVREAFEDHSIVMESKLDKVSERLGIAVVDRVPPPRNAKKNNFLIYRLYSGEVDFIYAVACVQTSGIGAALRRIKKSFPNASMIHRMVVPNAKVLLEHLRQDLKETASIEGNYVRLLKEQSDNEFIAAVEYVYDMRKDV